jgi:hypothetical protein
MLADAVAQHLCEAAQTVACDARLSSLLLPHYVASILSVVRSVPHRANVSCALQSQCELMVGFLSTQLESRLRRPSAAAPAPAEPAPAHAPPGLARAAQRP